MSRSFSKWQLVIMFPVWVLVGFFASQLIVGLLYKLLAAVFGSQLGIANETVLNTVLYALIYLIAITIVIGLPWWAMKYHTNRKELGYVKLPTWTDILLTPAAWVVYLLMSGILLTILSNIFSWIDIDQVQNIGFENISQRYEYLMAFITLVVVAPIAEETLFRGYLFGKLKKQIPLWAAILITSLMFGALHGAWNVGIDTFALSIVLCVLRQMTGSLCAPILLHMSKNAIAYYFLFINPSLFNTLVK